MNSKPGFRGKEKFAYPSESSTFIRIWANMGLMFVLALALCISLNAQTRVVIGSEDDLKVDGAQRLEIVEAVCGALNEVYVFPDKAKEMENFVREQLNSGAYDNEDKLIPFTERLTMDLRSICHDKHLGIRPMPPKPEGAEEDDTPKDEDGNRVDRLRAMNFGFEKLERLPGNIGYVDLRMFADAEVAGSTAIAAMNFLSNCDALIFDLRQNGGGSPSMIQLLSSYLFEEPVHLNSFYIRKGDKTKQFWSHAHVEGPRMVNVPVYVLTSNYTFSAAEEFTYNLKNLERATIVGETTGGGAHPVEFKGFPKLHVGMSLPFGRAVNPITGTNWEGTGIEPHIAVASDKALDMARLDATKKLLDKATNPAQRAQLEWGIQSLEAAMNPLTLTKDSLGDYAGTFGVRKIWLKDGKLCYQREGRNAFTLYPMGRDLFGLKGLEYFRIRFERDTAGKVVKLVGLYDNGMTDSNERSGS